MATAPKFSHASATDVTFNKGLIYPYNKDGRRMPIQKIGYAVGGAVKVADFGNVVYFWDILIKDNVTKRDALLAFFADADVNYAANTFTFYPEGAAGTSYTVRVISSDLDFYDSHAGVYIMKMTLRKEIT